MSTHERYELIEPIAKGDFAVVFRGRDRELGREVAIKQIHQQYLDDPAQLERYWQEAQLLASLEHPHIMTIYDVVRSRGWLVLELMQGSLQQKLAGNPIDLEDLRLTLVYTLSALQFLHKNGIVHGDVKPGNLLLDRNSRIKLGDFGIARRMSSGDGSVVKGTTKYMAPEVLSDQFGEVGPHSDIYSLGFSAYELMCGSHFESLFPGLHMFGRDPQVAWMMWHSAPDRRLPEINKVLEGVPEDLAHVIEKMTEKDPTRRYRDAGRPMAELRARGEKAGAGEDEEDLAEASKAAQHDRNKRLLLIGALAVSVILSLVVLFLPTGGEGDGDNPNAQSSNTTDTPQSGAIAHIQREGDPPFLVVIDPGGERGELPVDPAVDRFYVNDKRVEFAELKQDDQIEKIEHLKNAEDEPFQEIFVIRPVTESISGKIASLRLGAGKVLLTVPGRTDPLQIYVPRNARLQLNQQNMLGGHPIALRDLKLDDQLEVQYFADEGEATAVAVSATRPLTARGHVTAVNSAQRTLSFRESESSDAAVRTLPLAEDCIITINGALEMDGQPLTLAQLKVNDRVEVTHDSHVRSLKALRGLETEVTVTAVDAEGGKFTAGDVTFSLAPDCEVRVVGLEEPVTLKFLRPGDKAAVSHNSFDLKAPVATSVTITPTSDAGVWAMVLADPRYAEDAQLVQSALIHYYRVPEDQLFFTDTGLPERKRPQVTSFLERVGKDSQLVTYIAGDGAITDGVGYVMQDVPSNWMLSQLEAAQAGDRLVVLDCCHEEGQPSAFEVAQLRHGAGVPVSESVAVVAGCKPDETGLPHEESGRGLLAYFTAQAFRGQADQPPQDHRVRGEELATYLTRNLALATTDREARQTPHLFTPGAVPRLHPDVQEAVRKMLVFRRINEAYLQIYEPAAKQAAAAGQPDVAVAHALMLLQTDMNSNHALPLLQQVQAEYPTEISALPMLAWLEFAQTDPVASRREMAYRKAILELDILVRNLPEPPEKGGPPPYAEKLVRLAGSLRHFAVTAAAPQLTPDTPEVKHLDSFFLGRADAYEMAYRDGIDVVNQEFARLKKSAETAPNEALRELRTKSVHRMLSYVNYDSFPFEAVADLIRARLN